MSTATQHRITVYDIPGGKVHSVVAYDFSGQKMSQEPMVAGLYLRDPLRSRPDQELMCLVPVDETPAYSRIVRVSDVAEFARNFVPEFADPLVDALAQEVRETAKSLGGSLS